VNPFDELVETGSTILRGLFDGATAAALHQRADGLYAAWAQRRDQGGLEAMEIEHLAGATIVFRSLAKTTAGRDFMLDVIEAFMHSPAFALYRQLFDDEIAFLLDVCQLRRQNPQRHAPQVPYHQDLSFVGTDFMVVNSWIPLDSCGPGAASPGLEVAGARVAEDLRIGGLPARGAHYFDLLEIDAATVQRRFPAAALRHPDMAPGDAVLFDQFTVHRTDVRPHHATERTSIEVRACRAASVPADHPLRARLIARCDGDAVRFSI
jgi:hypothetical protein